MSDFRQYFVFVITIRIWVLGILLGNSPLFLVIVIVMIVLQFVTPSTYLYFFALVGNSWGVIWIKSMYDSEHIYTKYHENTYSLLLINRK